MDSCIWGDHDLLEECKRKDKYTNFKIIEGIGGGYIQGGHRNEIQWERHKWEGNVGGIDDTEGGYFLCE